MGLLTLQKHSGCGQSQLQDVQISRSEAPPMKDKELSIIRRAVQLTLLPRGVVFLLLVEMSHLTSYVLFDHGRLHLPQVLV